MESHNTVIAHIDGVAGALLRLSIKNTNCFSPNLTLSPKTLHYVAAPYWCEIEDVLIDENLALTHCNNLIHF